MDKIQIVLSKPVSPDKLIGELRIKFPVLQGCQMDVVKKDKKTILEVVGGFTPEVHANEGRI